MHDVHAKIAKYTECNKLNSVPNNLTNILDNPSDLLTSWSILAGGGGAGIIGFLATGGGGGG